MPRDRESVTTLLRHRAAGDKDASDQLMLVDDQLRRLAAKCLPGEHHDATFGGKSPSE